MPARGRTSPARSADSERTWALGREVPLEALPQVDGDQVGAGPTRLEAAWAGLRVQVVRAGREVRVWGEDRREWTASFAPVVAAVRALPAEELVLEGTVCVLGDDGRAHLEGLRAWAAGQRQGQLRLQLIDVWWLDGEALRPLALDVRLGHLERLLSGAPAVLRPPVALPGTLEAALAGALSLGFVGLLARGPRGCVQVGPAAARCSISPAPKLTSASKVLFPADGFTKQDVFSYYRDVAPVLVPYLQGRPVVAQRWPDGLDGFTWYQHRPPPRGPDYLDFVRLDDDRRLLLPSEDALLWMVNQAALTYLGWTSRAGSFEHPDFAIVDLDPGPEVSWSQVVEVALAVRAALELLEVSSVLKTSGQRGLHVLVPLAPGHSFTAVQAFVDGLARLVESVKPALVSTAAASSAPALRKAKVHLDVLQGFRGKTLVLPYSLRGVAGAPVSTPLRWDELGPGLSPKAFTLRTLRQRLDAVGDLTRPILDGPRVELARPLARLEGRS